jgi:hypothetical protein
MPNKTDITTQNTENTTRYWLGVVSQSHVQIGVHEGFAQLNHGKRSSLARMHRGDWLVYYSPRTDYPNGDLLQAFTAIGQVLTDTPYQVTIPSGFQPYRHDIHYLPCQPIPIHDLLPDLTFIPDKQHWGARLRFGHLPIPQPDFLLIAHAMNADDKHLQITLDIPTTVGVDLSERTPIHRASSSTHNQPSSSTSEGDLQ